MKTMIGILVGRIASARCFVTDFLSGRWRARQTLRGFERSMALPFPPEDLLFRAMDTFDIDLDEFCVRNPAWFQDMERTCMRCAGRGACRRIMSRGEFVGWYRGFCPNAEDFAQIVSPALDRG